LDTSNNRKQLIDELEREAERLHNATRTDIPFLSPVHNLLRTRLPFYYDWSTYPKTPTIHRVGVLGFLASFMFFTLLQFAIPNLFIPETKNVSAKPVELSEQRQPNIKVFKNPNGKDEYRVYASNIHYKDASGNYQEIDTSITNPKDSRLTVDKAPYNLSFDKNPKQSLTFTTSSYSKNPKSSDIVANLSDNPNMATAEVTGDKALYKDVYNNTNLERIALSNGIKQNYILKSPDHP